MQRPTAPLPPAPAFVTFTGIDASTDVDRICSLSQRHPIEWGILFSPDRQGQEPRYPALDHVERFLRMNSTAARGNRRLRLAAHLCGGYARAVEATDEETLAPLRRILAGNFCRVQVNTRRAPAPALVDAFARSLSPDTTGILQCRGAFPGPAEVDWLFDMSGGHGLSPSAWPEPSADLRFAGYAGGLSPETVGAAIAEIAPRHQAWRPYWLDCETGVRTDDKLDLDRCEAMLEIAFPAR